jgi:hypothetical protein
MPGKNREEKKADVKDDWARVEARRSIMKYLRYLEDYMGGRELHE